MRISLLISTVVVLLFAGSAIFGASRPQPQDSTLTKPETVMARFAKSAALPPNTSGIRSSYLAKHGPLVESRNGHPSIEITEVQLVVPKN